MESNREFFVEGIDDEVKNRITESDIFAVKEYPFSILSEELSLVVFRVGINLPGYYHFIGLKNEDGFSFAYCGFSDSEFAFADVDGDGVDEICVHAITPVSSRDGPVYICEVYKWSDGMFNSFDIDFDMGFRMVFKSEEDCAIFNIYTNKEVPIDTSLLRAMVMKDNLSFGEEFIYDVQIENVLGTPYRFLSFKPADVDNDGVFEIITEQIFAVEGKHYYPFIGRSFAAFKYNKESGQFNVMHSAFIQSGNDGDIEDPNDTWYKNYI